MPRPPKTALPAIPDGAIVRKNKRKPQSDTEHILTAYLDLLDAIEQHGSGFEFPMEENLTGDPRVTYNNTLALQRFYASVQIPDYEFSHMLRGDPTHKMLEEKRATVKALLAKLTEETNE